MREIFTFSRFSPVLNIAGEPPQTRHASNEKPNHPQQKTPAKSGPSNRSTHNRACQDRLVELLSFSVLVHFILPVVAVENVGKRICVKLAGGQSVEISRQAFLLLAIKLGLRLALTETIEFQR
jgi:nitrate reductase NapE component